ncbi:hypothetical protein OG762_48345 (plasmid) [Streptomyces sp. NBC_01136]|uniref:hypothetical protein n=1 Tax=unclassified Streptomyces TaxID=2593676 RepID=UPI002F90C41A|nr:hypothetical protein OG762_48345 [Streptomyces sp. NBC_01136]
MNRRVIASSVIAVAVLSGVTACNDSSLSAPSCATHQEGLSVTQQSNCLTEVGNWCQKNYPDDLACSDKVYGYVPGKPGS